MREYLDASIDLIEIVDVSEITLLKHTMHQTPNGVVQAHLHNQHNDQQKVL